jgi:hypothetical protein
LERTSAKDFIHSVQPLPDATLSDCFGAKPEAAALEQSFCSAPIPDL